MTFNGFLEAAAALVALVSAVVLFRPTVIKHLDEYRNRHRLRFRAEADFALKMYETTGEQRYLKMVGQLGLAGLLGGPDLSDAQRQALAALGDPYYWGVYERCSRFVQINEKADAPFGWRDNYKDLRGQRIFRYGTFALTVCLALLCGFLMVALSRIPRMRMSEEVLVGAFASTFLLMLLFSLLLWTVMQLSAFNEAKKLIAELSRKQAS